MNVLSLFDGMSGGQESLQELNIKYDKYYSSEIEPSCLTVTQYNFPNTIQLGDVANWRKWNIDWKTIDLLIGGSPCQGFSIAGNKLSFEDERSKLFFVYLDILNYLKSINPNIKFLLENVKMEDGIADKIDELLGVSRTFLDSRYFSGMIRKRYYWTNICFDKEYDKSITHSIQESLDNSISFDKDLNFFLDRTVYAPNLSYDGIITINPRDNNGKQTWQRGRVYDVKGNCPTICASLFDLNITQNHKTYRKLVRNELERLQGFPIGYTSVVSFQQAGTMLGNGWNIPTIKHILKAINK